MRMAFTFKSLPKEIGTAVLAVASSRAGRPKGSSDAEVLRAALVELRHLRKEMRAAEDELVAALLADGVEYAELAELLGISYKAVWARYASTENSTPEDRRRQSAKAQSRAPKLQLPGMSIKEAATALKGITTENTIQVHIRRALDAGERKDWFTEVRTETARGTRRTVRRIIDLDGLREDVHGAR